jgi:hypothetical protein
MASYLYAEALSHLNAPHAGEERRHASCAGFSHKRDFKVHR